MISTLLLNEINFLAQCNHHRAHTVFDTDPHQISNTYMDYFSNKILSTHVHML
jgi:hypothetical protein